MFTLIWRNSGDTEVFADPVPHMTPVILL